MKIENWLGENNKLGMDIWKQKYEYNNEGFDSWLDRVSNGNEEVKERIFNKKFLFGGRILSNRGLQKIGKKITYSNCFNLGEVEDNLEGIFQTASDMAKTYSAGGGCGVNLGKLRPNNSVVHNNAKTSSGIVPFMDMYSKVTETIGQSGRRGALMICLPIDHPDIEEFISCKENMDKVVKANISVIMNDDFMKAVLNNEDYILHFYVEQTGEEITRPILAKYLFRKIAEQAWNNAEPGILFKNRIDEYNLMSNVEEYKITGTNPCGEIPMPSMSACLLGSINLSEYVLDPFTSNAKFDYKSLQEDVRIYVKALNECLFENIDFLPLQAQKDAVNKYQAIGLGYFGVADMFVKMSFRYGSSQAIHLVDIIGNLVAKEAIKTSDSLCCTYGASELVINNSEKIISSDFYQHHFYANEQHIPINTSLLTCAPTGSLSTMIGVSGGIEPIFSLKMTRKTESLNDGVTTYYEVDIPVIEEWKKHNKTDEVPDWIKNSTAMNLDIKERVMMQAMWQSHIDNAISSTINLAEETTVEQVEDLFLLAWKTGLKGITVYRSGCSRGAILTESKPVETVIVESDSGLKWGDTIKCSNNLIGLKRKIMTGCGSMHVGAYYDTDGNLREVFFNKGSDGGCNAFMTGLSRTASLAARSGASMYKIVDQLASVPACPSYVARTATKHDTSKGKNCPSAIGNALLEMQKEIETIIKNGCVLVDATTEVIFKEVKVDLPKKSEQDCIDENICPLCYEGEHLVNLVAGGGCYTCNKCGFSKCE